MKKILGITFGGLQNKTVNLVLLILAVTVLLFVSVTAYQNKMLVRIVDETRSEQQQAITQTSEETMNRILGSALVKNAVLRAQMADDDFAEIIKNVLTLQTMAQGLLENRAALTPAVASLPDPALDGTVSAMVLCEEGVDYTQSETLGIIAHMSSPMIAMTHNSDKIDGCFIGLEDGTDLCVDDKAGGKYDENGRLIPFPVRERPWYRGAIETGGVYFTGVTGDAFSGKLLVTCSAPVYAGEELVGVVGIDIVLKSMDYFEGNYADSGVYIYVVNDKGETILSSDEDGVFQKGSAGTPPNLMASGNEALIRFLHEALEQTTALTEVVVDGTPYYMVGSPMPTIGWTVLSVIEKEVTELPEEQLLQEYDRINAAAAARFESGTARTNRTALLLIAGVFILGAIAATFAAKKIVRPIEEMTRNIVRSDQGGKLFEMKDSYRTNDEIEVLARSFEDLSKKTRLYIENITSITREKERVSTELQTAREIQAGMLPSTYPAFPEHTDFDIYATMDPAREVGGDFYDFFLIDDDHLCMVMADVSGKGVPAALFMMASKIILANNAMMGKSPAQILTDANAAICSNNRMEMFVTVWLGILELSTGKLTAANAGHEYPVIKQAEGDYTLYKDKHGFVVGGMEGVRYKEYELTLEPGARLFLYTDGVTEATNADNALFGTERMVAALNTEPDADPKKVLKNVRSAIDGFVGDAEQFDDLTMLCMQYNGRGARKMSGNELTVSAVIENIPQVTDFVDALLEACDCPMKAETQINVAVDEILCNVASYAYGPEGGDVTIRFDFNETSRLATITFLDRGTPFDPLSEAEPDVTLPAEEREIGGLGIFMVKKMMDSVAYRYEDGCNILTVSKKI